VGGSGVKAGIVDVESGELISERLRLDTPEPSTPDAVAATVKELVDQLDAPGPIGLGSERDDEEVGLVRLEVGHDAPGDLAKH